MNDINEVFSLLSGLNFVCAYDLLRKLANAEGFCANSLSREGVSLLNAAIAVNGLPVVEFLLSAGADPNLCDVDGSPLGLAAGKGSVELCKVLVAAGAEPNQKPVAGTTTPLMKASGRPANLPALKWLICAGADVNLAGINVKGQKSGTALSRAAATGNIDAVRILLQSGADPNVIFASGTALSQAVENGGYEIVKLLLDAGADRLLVAPTSAGFPLADKTPLEIARMKKHQALIDLLADETAGIRKSADPQGLVNKILSRAKEIGLKLRPGATKTELTVLERSCDVTVPKILQELLARCNGESEDSDGMFPPPSGSPLDDSFLLMHTGDIEQARRFILEAHNDEGQLLCPFAQDGLGDYLCVDCSSDSDAVTHVEHETRSIKLINNSLHSWLAGLVTVHEA